MATDLERNVAKPFMCTGVCIVVAAKDGEGRGVPLFLVVFPV